jgi:hypothetical protein
MITRDNGLPMRIYFRPVPIKDESNVKLDQLHAVDELVCNIPEVTLFHEDSESIFVLITNKDVPSGEKAMIVEDKTFPLKETRESGLFKVIGLTYPKLINVIKCHDIITLTEDF